MINLSISTAELNALRAQRITPAISRAVRKASGNSVREMRTEASRIIRSRKALKLKHVRKALVPRKARGRGLDQSWGLDVSGKRTRLSDYPHRQVKAGVRVEVNKGSKALVRSAFVATMRGSGHKGIFVRRGARRLPIKELMSSRPVDVLRESGESERVAVRGARSFFSNLDRLLKAELDKG